MDASPRNRVAFRATDGACLATSGGDWRHNGTYTRLDNERRIALTGVTKHSNKSLARVPPDNKTQKDIELSSASLPI